MAINPTQALQQLNNDTARVQFEQGAQNRGSGEIDKNGFLQLMLAQLRYQNPIEPVDNTEQLMQQAQFTQVEELQNLNATLSRGNDLTQAATLVGKEVNYTDNNGQPQSGTVDSVILGDDIGLQIGGDTISVDQLQQINATPVS